MSKLLTIKSHFETTALNYSDTEMPAVVTPGTSDVCIHVSQINTILVNLLWDDTIPADLDTIIIESPFIPFTQDSSKDKWDWINKIAASQQKHGAIKYLLHTLFPKARVIEASSVAVRKSVYGADKPTLDTLLSLANAKYNTYKKISVKAELCVADTILLRNWYTNHYKK